MLFFIFSVLLAAVVANPILLNRQQANPGDAPPYLYALDFATVASASQLQCVKKQNYSVVFVRGYSPVGKGTFDTNAVANINNAYSAGLGVEVYMTPQPSSTKHGYTQLDEMYNGLKNSGITVRAVWIQVTPSGYWSSSTATNVNFIKSILTRARNIGMSVGIYTNVYNWIQITGAWNAGNNVMLWNFNVAGPAGLSGESTPDFSDFVPFCTWNKPTVKQFAQTETVCGISPLNRDFYTNSNMVMKDLVSGKNLAGSVVGGNIH